MIYQPIDVWLTLCTRMLPHVLRELWYAAIWVILCAILRNSSVFCRSSIKHSNYLIYSLSGMNRTALSALQGMNNDYATIKKDLSLALRVGMNNCDNYVSFETDSRIFKIYDGPYERNLINWLNSEWANTIDDVQSPLRHHRLALGRRWEYRSGKGWF